MAIFSKIALVASSGVAVKMFKNYGNINKKDETVVQFGDLTQLYKLHKKKNLLIDNDNDRVECKICCAEFDTTRPLADGLPTCQEIRPVIFTQKIEVYLNAKGELEAGRDERKLERAKINVDSGRMNFEREQYADVAAWMQSVVNSYSVCDLDITLDVEQNVTTQYSDLLEKLEVIKKKANDDALKARKEHARKMNISYTKEDCLEQFEKLKKVHADFSDWEKRHGAAAIFREQSQLADRVQPLDDVLAARIRDWVKVEKAKKDEPIDERTPEQLFAARVQAMRSENIVKMSDEATQTVLRNAQLEAFNFALGE